MKYRYRNVVEPFWFFLVLTMRDEALIPIPHDYVLFYVLVFAILLIYTSVEIHFYFIYKHNIHFTSTDYF